MNNRSIKHNIEREKTIINAQNGTRLMKKEHADSFECKYLIEG